MILNVHNVHQCTCEIVWQCILLFVCHLHRIWLRMQPALFFLWRNAFSRVFVTKNHLKSKNGNTSLFYNCYGQLSEKMRLCNCSKKTGVYWQILLLGEKVKLKGFKKIAWNRSYHLQWKFNLLVGKFTWGNKAKHCWVMSTNFLFS